MIRSLLIAALAATVAGLPSPSPEPVRRRVPNPTGQAPFAISTRSTPARPLIREAPVPT